jgi:hypothetical protein
VRPLTSAAEVEALLASRFGITGVAVPDAWFEA